MKNATYRPLGWTRKGRPIWPAAGGNGTGDGSGDGGSSADGAAVSGSGDGAGSGSTATGSGDGATGAGSTSDGGSSAKGFPENTPVADMTPEQQAAYWRTYARQHEQRNRDLLALADGTPDGLKNKLAELEQLRQSQMTDQQRAVEAAKEEARTEARNETLRELGGRMVDAHIEAAVTAQRLTQDQADVLLEGLDRTKYLTTEGKVDADKVKTLLDRFAPAKGNGFPDLGQGRRHGQAKPSVSSGREMFAESRKGRATQDA